MERIVKSLVKEDAHGSIVRVLQAWRLWLLGALVGALVAAGVYFLFPPAYRASAVVVIDHNLEAVWQGTPRQAFYFLGRETRKLERLAWSDKTLDLVAEELDGYSVSDLRNGILSLSHPADGGWELWADHPDRATAEKIAGTWARIFVDQIYLGMDTSLELELARRDINQLMLEYPKLSLSEINDVIERESIDYSSTSAISPWLEVYLAEGSNLSVYRKVSLSTYALGGSGIGALGFALAALVITRSEEKDEDLATG